MIPVQHGRGGGADRLHCLTSAAAVAMLLVALAFVGCSSKKNQAGAGGPGDLGSAGGVRDSGIGAGGGGSLNKLKKGTHGGGDGGPHKRSEGRSGGKEGRSRWATFR